MSVLDPLVQADLVRLDRPDRPGVYARVLQLYVSNAADLRQRALQAQAAGDAIALHRALHNLRSTSASVGARALEAAIRPLELRAREGSVQLSIADWAALDSELAAAQSAVGELLARPLAANASARSESGANPTV